MPRTRTTKKLAQRINLHYFKRLHAFRRWRLLLSIALPALAGLWLAWHGAVTRNNRVYSSGTMSAAHAVLATKCTACHISQTAVFREHARDAACLDCHDGPIHHATQVFTPNCASCHIEHRGPGRLAATNDSNCTQCHSGLRATGGAPRFERVIESFPSRHPEFAALRPGRRDPGTIKLNHFVHLKPKLEGPNKRPVQMECADCHRTPAVNQPWPYVEAQVDRDTAQPKTTAAAGRPDPLAPKPTRAYMAPIKFPKHCAACHLLQFDKRFTEGVPHGEQPDKLHDFLVKKFQEYIPSHPAELRVVREPERNVTGKPIPPSVRVLTPPQWVAERVAEAEQLLWRKTCHECHTLRFPEGAPLPEVAKSNITVRWMSHAVFDHNAHRLLTCTSCHAGAPRSKETSDVLLPGIATCQTCHHAGAEAAESRCFECHTYHDWSKQKEVKGKFVLPRLLRGAETYPTEASLPKHAAVE